MDIRRSFSDYDPVLGRMVSGDVGKLQKDKFSKEEKNIDTT